VWAGHGAGSACGKSLGAVPSATVGYEKIRNWAFKFKDNVAGFVNELLEGQPEAPRYFAVMKHLNKVHRPLLVEVPKPSKLSSDEFINAYNDGLTIIDTRDKTAFAKGFIPGSLNIQGNNSFSTWMGWLLNYEEQFVLIAEDSRMEDLTRKLMRIGMDNNYGYITAVDDLGIYLQVADVIAIDEFKTYVGNTEVQIVDVRSENEYKAGHIEGADHVFVGTLQDNLEKISKDKLVIVHCQSGDRSTIAYSILRKHGFDKVKNYSGGMQEWRAQNNPVIK